ncbi:hypothetical protein [Emticicia fontis]
MKTVGHIILLLSFSIICEAQNNWEKVSDALALISRQRADMVLSHFDTIQAPKILYALENKEFYLIIKSKPDYNEYYVRLNNSGEIESVRPIKAELITEKQKQQQDHYRKLLSEAEPIFDVSTYHTNYITKIPEATNSSGRPSYFVLKDIDGKRYGEYNLSAINTPMPIKSSLWAYLMMNLSDEMARERQ